MAITIYSFDEFQKLAREGGLPLESPALNTPVLTNATGSLNNVPGDLSNGF